MERGFAGIAEPVYLMERAFAGIAEPVYLMERAFASIAEPVYLKSGQTEADNRLCGILRDAYFSTASAQKLLGLFPKNEHLRLVAKRGIMIY